MMRSSLRMLVGVAMLVLALGNISSRASAIDRKYWELSPYSIHLQLAVCDSLLETDEFSASLVHRLEERIFSTMHPLWTVSIEVATGESKYQQLRKVDSPESQEPREDIYQDKQFFLSLRQSAAGINLACREWDRSTQRWGPVMHRTVRQDIMLVEDCFQLLRDSFSPLANIETDSSDFSRVFLTFKGSDLPRRTSDGSLVESIQVMLPLRIRYDHSGEVLPNGIMEVPWTYLTTQQTEEGWLGRVHSGSKRPFGVRRRGRSQYVAIAVQNPPAPTSVRFYPRHDKERGLAGYEVFQRFTDDQPSELLALTDSSGSVLVPPADVKIVTLFLRSDGQLLAKVPVPPGAKQNIEIPIADDTARLQAQAQVNAIREQLIDVVARRAILISRIRSHVEAKEFEEANKLLGTLDDLPGRAQFEQKLRSAERKKSNTSSDPRVQAKIKRLFSDTGSLLGRFLDVRQITDLRSEVKQASEL